jgi:hypothetical protein
MQYLILPEIFGRQAAEFCGKTRRRSVVARAVKSILRIVTSREIGIVSPEFWNSDTVPNSGGDF